MRLVELPAVLALLAVGRKQHLERSSRARLAPPAASSPRPLGLPEGKRPQEPLGSPAAAKLASKAPTRSTPGAGRRRLGVPQEAGMLSCGGLRNGTGAAEGPSLAFEAKAAKQPHPRCQLFASTEQALRERGELHAARAFASRGNAAAAQSALKECLWERCGRMWALVDDYEQAAAKNLLLVLNSSVY